MSTLSLFQPRSINAQRFKPTRATISPIKVEITHWSVSIETTKHTYHHIVPKGTNLVLYMEHLVTIWGADTTFSFKPLIMMLS